MEWSSQLQASNQNLYRAPTYSGEIAGFDIHSSLYPIWQKLRSQGPALGLYYLWNLVTAVILLNILISLFSSAYQDVVADAEAQYLAFFAGKAIGMIR